MSYMYSISKCQKVSIPQGAIYLGPSDEKKSLGYLELNPYTSLTLHNRPAIEKLTQVKNISNVVVYDSENGRVVRLGQGEKLVMKANV